MFSFYAILIIPDHGGWETWFDNSTHTQTTKLLKDLEYVANLEEGINNVTQAFFWPYAFLGSRAEIEYIVATNSSALVVGKRSALHISDKCFGLFYTGLALPHQSVYTESFNHIILRMQQAGLMGKFADEVAGKMRKLGGGRLLDSSASKSLAQTSADERGLTLADTEGMFLLLGVGFLIAAGVLISEWVGGCSQKCRSILVKRRDDQRRAQEEDDDDGVLGSAKKPPTRKKSSSIFHRSTESVTEEVGREKSVSGGSRMDSRDDIDCRKSGKSAQSAESRKTSVSLNIFNRQTLQDMSEGGHKRRHSNIIYMDGDLMVESDALGSISHKYEQLENQSVSGSLVGNSQILEVEINRVEK